MRISKLQEVTVLLSHEEFEKLADMADVDDMTIEAAAWRLIKEGLRREYEIAP